jgi:hypothetical protein
MINYAPNRENRVDRSCKLLAQSCKSDVLDQPCPLVSISEKDK